MNWKLKSKALQECSIALSLLFICCDFYWLEVQTNSCKEELLIRETGKADPSICLTRPMKWSGIQRKKDTVSSLWKAVWSITKTWLHSVCFVIAGGKQEWPRFLWNVLSLVGEDIGWQIWSPDFNADCLGRFITTPLNKIGHIGYQLVVKYTYMCYQYFWRGMTKFCCYPSRNSSFSRHSKFLFGC